MRKNFLFSTRTYLLRKWIEETYSCKPLESKTSESTYYRIKLTHGRSFKIRISDHLSTNSSYFKICAVADLSDINKTIYIVQNGKLNLTAYSSLNALKYEIARNVEILRASKLEIDEPDDEDFEPVKAKSKSLNSTIKEINETASSEESLPISIEALNSSEMFKNSKKRMNYWPNLCWKVSGYGFMDKKQRSYVRAIFSTNTDFDECVRIVAEITKNASHMPGTNLANALRLKAESLKRNAGLLRGL